MQGPSLCLFSWLGTVEYLSARSLQDSLVGLVHDGESPNTLLILEHPHVYTRGRLSQAEHLLSSEDELAASGVPVHDTDRGGQVTYHGPGQLVGYPIINLRDWSGGPLKYVRTLEQTIVDTLADFGIPAHTEQGLTGVWTTAGKVAAIGVKISRGVSFHGFSVNINTDLSWYRHIVSCGIADRPVTSMSRLLGEKVDQEAVRYSLVYRFGRAMGMRMSEVSPSEFVLAEE
ncbi:Octanoyltransferase [Geodia barretti]|uniref:Octanoyl-[acyl-carrier-protein]:protein N-octanoyltransferase LIPT2, mitochondrial n=1 Tax=Geodia barretti TaxID=519541 RepID=A0AA35W8J4_GEOBA|nr:Octanoyltransferase [Geodia barretti]